MSSKSHRWSLVAMLVVAATALAAPASAAVPTDQELRDDAGAREQRSDLAGAYSALIRVAEPSKAERTHIQHLSGTLHALTAAESLERQREGAAAVKLLDAQVAKLDPIEDRFLVAALARESAQAGALARADANEAARATLDKAATLERRGQWIKAAAVYKSVAAQPAGSIDAALRREGLVGQLRAEGEAAAREPGKVMGPVADTLRGILRWLLIAAIPFVLLLALAGYGRVMRRMPKRGTSVALTEIVDEGRGNPRRDQALSLELADAIQDEQQAALATGAAGLEELRDLDGTAVPLVRSGTFAVAAQPLDDNAQITIGPVGVNVVQLLHSLRRMLARPGETELTGTLRFDGEVAYLSLQGSRAGETLGPWNATGATRSEAIRAVAEQYVVQSGQSRITPSWPSYQAYCEAVRTLDANAGKDTLRAARAALERSLAHDGANLPARLRLGAVLRMLGDNEQSAGQLDMLIADVRAKDTLPPLARALVEEHPELEYVARYERNIALAKVDDRQREARAGLGQLVKDLEQRPDDPALSRLFPLALAAWGAAQLGSGHDRASRRRVLGKLNGVARRLEAGGGNGGRREAIAVIENARARVLYRLGQYADARRAADQALAITPDLTDARITLACIYMKTRDDRSQWIEPTRRQLERAQEVSPEDPRLLYRLGRFYDLQDEAECAKRYYAQIPQDWKALERHAGVLEREEAFDDAFALRVRAHRINPAGGDRVDALITAFLAAGRAKDGDIDLVVACAQASAGDALTHQRLGAVRTHADALRRRRAHGGGTDALAA